MLSCSVWFSAPSFWKCGGLESRCVGRVYDADGAMRRYHLHRTHDPGSGSQDHHPSSTQRLSRPPTIQKLGVENHMLQLNI